MLPNAFAVHAADMSDRLGTTKVTRPLTDTISCPYDAYAQFQSFSADRARGSTIAQKSTADCPEIAASVRPLSKTLPVTLPSEGSTAG